MSEGLHNSLDARYKGGWTNVQKDCMLCEMEQKTKWYLETTNWVVAEKLGGGPFAVYKEHKESLSDEEWAQMEHIVGLCFDEFELRVRMNLCKHHFHAHILTPEQEPDLSGE